MTQKPLSNATVYIDDTLKTTGLSRPSLVYVCTHLVRSGQAKNVGEAFKMLDSGTVDVTAIEDLIIESFRAPAEQQSQPEVPETEVN
jgi:hypothetical protein|tara:strand:+ start:198 stop:458 length:261 start_codon:yes stop_codon:yes gene_type:complete